MIERRTLLSDTLGAEMKVVVVRPDTAERLPVAYLLHGRGDSADSWEPVLADLAGLPLIAVLAEAPWSSRAGYYVDSLHEHGRPVETAITRDLLAWADAELPTRAQRAARIVAGYSMGGFGALRLGLAHPDLFGAAVALSPAVYAPEPPVGSSARDGGAFGRGPAAFDRERFTELNYPAALDAFPRDLPFDLTLAVGDAEPGHPGAAEALSVARQVTAVVERIRSVTDITVTHRVYPGGHDFSVWRPALSDALKRLCSTTRWN